MRDYIEEKMGAEWREEVLNEQPTSSQDQAP